MSSAASNTNLRVFVTFKEDTIFAGDEIEATITFKNVPVPRNSTGVVRTRTGAAPAARPPSVASQWQSRPAHSRQASTFSQATRVAPDEVSESRHGHRQALSLNLKGSSSFAAERSVGNNEIKPRKAHGRSVSIVSLGSDAGGSRKGERPPVYRDPTRPGFKLSRSASVQISPTSSGSPRWSASTSMPARLPSTSYGLSDDASLVPTVLGPHRSPLSPSTTHNNEAGRPPFQNMFSSNPAIQRNGSPPDCAPTLPQDRSSLARASQRSRLPPSSFRFPPAAQNGTPEIAIDSHAGAAHGIAAAQQPLRSASSPNRRPQVPQLLEARGASPELKPPPLNRVMSLASDHGTARSSLDLYSASNHSDETMISDYAQGPATRLLNRSASARVASQQTRPKQQAAETLMMGFAHLHGCFTLDGSLVNQAPFEDVKRRAVVGGQGGGGVVGIEQSKNETGLFGSLGWGSIGESLGGLIGGGEPSSIREMKGVAQSKSIPLLTTPKSILFVDLKLEPGESKSYTYSFPLPRGLPPSHRGRAMKVAYQIVIGTQRPGPSKSSQKQQIRLVEIPFRVFGGVDGQGEILGHDLMSPYIVLRDQARTAAVNHDKDYKPKTSTPVAVKQAKSSEADFNTYITDLLSSARQGPTGTLLSPTRSVPSTPYGNGTFPSSTSGDPPSSRVLIDNAIRMSTQPVHQTSSRSSPQPSTSQTKFTIARAGAPIAQLTLSRPALRLGDLLHITLDFSPSSSMPSSPQSTPRSIPPVHAVTLLLESSESVDAALAIRSATSIERATRRVWDRRVIGNANAAALAWCRRWSGSFKVPSSATPGFATTGVSVNWVVRVEIAVGTIMDGSEQHVDTGDAGDRDGDERQGLQEEATGNEENEKLPMIPSDRSPSDTESPANVLEARQRTSKADELLELISSDERGDTHSAPQRLGVETFEIAVPIRVFGAVGAAGTDGVGGAAGNAEEGDGEGLAI